MCIFFFFKQKTAYDIGVRLVGSEMCIRDSHQEATLAVDSASPTAANSAIASASGVTSGSISFNVTDAQLAKTGYTYTIIGPTGSSYANLTAALASNALYDNTTNGSATTDSSAQAFRVLYKANVQSAQITVQEGSPISGGAALDAITCLLYTSPSPRDGLLSRMPSSAWKKKNQMDKKY